MRLFNTNMRNFLFLFVMFWACVHHIFAQTYATPELQRQAEKHIAEKNALLGIEKEEVPSVSAGTSIEEKTPFNLSLLSGTYRFIDIKAIDYQGKHSKQELETESKSAMEDFSRMYFAVSADLQTLYMASRNDPKDYSIRTLRNENGILTIQDCKDCQDNAYKIISQTENEMILELKPQDEGDYFVFSITLKK